MLEHFLPPYTTINFKRIKYLNVSLETIKLSEDKRGIKYLTKVTENLYDPSPQVMEIKTKTNMGPH